MRTIPLPILRWLRQEDIRVIRCQREGPGLQRLTLLPPGLSKLDFHFRDDQLETAPERVIATIEKAINKAHTRPKAPPWRLWPDAEVDYSVFLARKRAALALVREEDADDGPRAA